MSEIDRNAVLRLAARSAAPALSLALLAGCGQFGGDPAADAREQWAMLDRYCVECHNNSEFTAGITFEGRSPESVAEHAELFENAVRKLRGRAMPPPGELQPEGEEVWRFVAALERSLDAVQGVEHIPEQVVLHRLNRKEYANAIRDLLTL